MRISCCNKLMAIGLGYLPWEFHAAAFEKVQLTSYYLFQFLRGSIMCMCVVVTVTLKERMRKWLNNITNQNKRRRFGVVRTSDTEYSRWKNTEQKRTVSVALPAQIQKFWPLEILTLYFFPAPNSPFIFSSYHLSLNTISDSPKPLSISNKSLSQLIRHVGCRGTSGYDNDDDGYDRRRVRVLGAAVFWFHKRRVRGRNAEGRALVRVRSKLRAVSYVILFLWLISLEAFRSRK